MQTLIRKVLRHEYEITIPSPPSHGLILDKVLYGSDEHIVNGQAHKAIELYKRGTIYQSVCSSAMVHRFIEWFIGGSM